LAKELATSGVVIISGLARGIDTAALSSAMEHGGSVAAVIGTPIDKASPQENSALQTEIFLHHLLLTPFKKGETVYPSNFPKRNRVMAAISDATVIVEASDTSGTLHQAAECQALGRWLFILRTVVENPSVTWPTRFLNNSRTVILDETSQIIEALAR
jgi:DNA processing protein